MPATSMGFFFFFITKQNCMVIGNKGPPGIAASGLGGRRREMLHPASSLSLWEYGLSSLAPRKPSPLRLAVPGAIPVFQNDLSS